MTCFRRIAIALLLAVCATAQAEELSRADYRITLPAGASVKEVGKDEEVDKDHLSTIDLPNGSFLSIFVIDSKEFAGDAMRNLLADYRRALKDPVEGATTTFAKVKAVQSSTLNGRVNGVKASFEVGRIDGKKKAFVMTVFYVNRKRSATIDMIQKALDSFTLNE